MEGWFKKVCWVTQDSDVGSVHREQLSHLRCIEAQVITDNIEAHSRPIVFNVGALEKWWIKEVISAVGESKFELMILSEAEKDVEEGAAGCFVGLHEHDIHFSSTGLASSLLWAVCS